MTILQSVLLGIVQGITEFLPVSSSGHLSIIEKLFSIDAESSVFFNVLLHVGTLLVVIITYRKDIGKMILEFFGMIGDLFVNLKLLAGSRKKIVKPRYRRIVRNNYRKFVLLILVSTIPTGIMGILGKKLVTDASGSLLITGLCLLLTALLLLISDRHYNGTRIPQDMAYREAVIIGIAQGFAILPGLSRSGATITACLLLGLDRTFAVKYSFILSIPAILGAALLEMRDFGQEVLTVQSVGGYIAGMAAAFVVGFLCLKVVFITVKKRKFRFFAYYCMAAGIFSIICHFVLRGQG